MTLCNKNVFQLPELNFIGGDFKEIPFYIKDANTGTLLNDVQAVFSLIEYQFRNDDIPILSKELELKTSEDNSYFLLTLNSDDTIDLKGKFIYQITVNAPSPSRKQESYQGIMIIDRNINPTAHITVN